jgi:hypothetical protein
MSTRIDVKIVDKYLNEMKLELDDKMKKKIMKIIIRGWYKGKEELETEVASIESKFSNGKMCEKWRAPYIIVGDAEIVQVNDAQENAHEFVWGVPKVNEYAVKCTKSEYKIEYATFTEKRKECKASVKIVPKTPVVLVEEIYEDSCWTYNKRYYLYVHPYGWWTL